jgi:hypothetical protein
MWVETTALCSWIMENRRAFYYVKGSFVDLPIDWAAKFISEGTAIVAKDPEEPAFADPYIPPSLGNEMLTVACVFKSGGKYDEADYVGKLARAVGRHLTVPHRFICLTDAKRMLTADVDVVPLEKNWPGYWSKIEVYRPGLFKGPLLYLDLDTVISGSIDGLVAVDAPLAIAWDMMRNWVNSSLVFTRVDLSCVWDAMVGDSADIIARYDSGNGPYHGDQGLLQDTLTKKRIPWRWMQSIRPHEIIWMPPGLRGNKPPAETKVEMWYGDPKQPDVGGKWLGEHWT